MNAPTPATHGVRLLDGLWLLTLVTAVGSVYAWDRWRAPSPVAAATAPNGPQLPPSSGDLITPDPSPTAPPSSSAKEIPDQPDTAAPTAQVEPAPAVDASQVLQGETNPKTGDKADTSAPPAPSPVLAAAPPVEASEGEKPAANTIAAIEKEDVPETKILPLEPEAIEEDKPKLAVLAVTMPPPNQLDQVVHQFIQYDIGQLPGPAGQQALMAFNRLGTESVPALIRGLNQAACLSASCPIIVLTHKLNTTLQNCGPEMIELAISQLGVGVPSTAPYCRRLEGLKQQLFTRLSGDHPLRQGTELAARLAMNPAELPQYIRSGDPNQRWAAARAIVTGGAPLGDELIQLLGDSEPAIVQEARAGLVRLAGNKDFGPGPDANPAAQERALADWRSWWLKRSSSSVFRRVSRLTDGQLRPALAGQDAEERWAAVVVVGNRRLPYAEELTGLLRDPDRLVSREARKILVQLADGTDFGPPEEAEPAAVEAAVAKWQQWCRLQALIAQCEKTAPEELIAGFGKADPLERLAAVRVARARKLDRPEAFIQALGDQQPEISQEARHALVQISGGSDFGPSENTDQEAVQAAVARWLRWLRWHRLIVAYGPKTEPELLQIFGSAEPFERWAAVSVSRRKGFRPATALIELLRDNSPDVQQEARQALVEIAGGEFDFGPAEDSDPQSRELSQVRWTTWWQREELVPQLMAMSPEELAAAFRSPAMPQRWAAAAAARRMRAPLQPDLIQLVRDPDNEVRQEARRALAQAAGGSDFGPPETADAQAVEAAVQQWENWWAGEQERRETAAAQALKMARIILDKNPNAARKRLDDVVTQYAGTQSAQAAQDLLNKVPQVVSREDPPRGKSAPGAPRSATGKTGLAAEPEEKVAPEQLEKEAATLLRHAKEFFYHRPEMFRDRLRELIDRYPGTKAAREAQRQLEAEAAKRAATGAARKAG